MENISHLTKRTSKEASLQFGHGVAAVENLPHLGLRGGIARLGFNSATASPPWRTSVVEWVGELPVMPQFGHGVAAVENVETRTHWPLPKRLQFGHGVAAVENRTH